MHVFILILYAISIVPVFIASVFVGNFLRNRMKGISILDLYWVSGFGSILVSALGSYGIWLYNGEIPGLENTALKAAGIAAIVCMVYLVILRILLVIFQKLRGFFSKNQ